LLAPEEIALMVHRVESHGGLVSYRYAGGGAKMPYELNVTWYSALNRDDPAEDVDRQVARFVASRSIALALAGVPGIYLPSLFGSKNDHEAVRAGEGARAINRDTLDVPALEALIRDRRTWVSKVARRFGRLIRRRIVNRAFHPQSAQTVHDRHPHVFAVSRRGGDGSQVLALTNVSDREQVYEAPRDELACDAVDWIDVIDRQPVSGSRAGLTIRLPPYSVRWLAPIAGDGAPRS
jgi:sucrose phosphorylase